MFNTYGFPRTTFVFLTSALAGSAFVFSGADPEWLSLSKVVGLAVTVLAAAVVMTQSVNADRFPAPPGYAARRGAAA